MKKFKLLMATMLTISIANAQELDKNFLSSLPDDLKEDVLNRSDDRGKTSENKYNPYRYSSKLNQEEELIKLKERLEKDLEELERRLKKNNINIEPETELKLYGSDFFNTFQTSFMPINEPNPDSSYVLDIGDTLKIQLIGQKEYIKSFAINPDGSINLPDIGEINLAGKPIKEANDFIKSRVKQAYIGVDAYISLDKIRDVNILVTGNAKNPGIYTLTGNSNILHALHAAGGINEFGSYRTINLLRKNKIIETLDIYDLLIDGDFNISKRLRSGDVVFIEPAKNIVTIDGAVKRPAKYEVKDSEYLDRVIAFANGMKNTADILNISLERILDGSLKTIPIINSKQFKKIVPEDGDLIYIREFPYRQAKISGAVKKPGMYTMANNETLNDLIEKAGGFNKNAYPFGAIYLNEAAKVINKKSNDILYEEFLDNLIVISQKNVGSNMNLTPIITLTNEIRKAKPNGRIVIDIIDESKADLFTVSDGDELFIPELKNNIYLYGEVSSEGSILFEEGKDIEYFVKKSGGYKKYADVESIYILYPNGESSRYSKKRNIFESKPMSDIELYPGSIIFVPKRIDESTSNRLAAQAYVSILGSIGVTLASLSSINNN